MFRVSSLYTKTQPIQCSSNPRVQRRSFAQSSKSDGQTVHDYCASQIKKYDYENFLVGYFFPDASRRAFYAVRALNIELAHVKEVVTNPLAGQMRFQFWRDAIKSIYKNESPAHPVATALTEAVANFKLNRGWFSRLIDQRETDLLDDTVRTTEQLETYAENTASMLQYLALECLGVKNTHADHAASHLGKAIGITTLLRGTPYHSSKRRCYLPLDLLSKHGVSQESIYRGEGSKELQEVIYDVASTAKVHLDMARDLSKSVPNEAKPALLAAAIPDVTLTRLQKHGFNVFHPSIIQPAGTLPVKLFVNNLLKRY